MDDRTNPIESGEATAAKPASRRRRRTFVAAGLLTAIAVVLTGLLAHGDDSRAAVRAGGGGDTDALDESDAGSDATEDALAADDNSTGYPESWENIEESDGGGDGGSGEEGDNTLEPVPATGCAGGLEPGASLLVTPDPAVLPSGAMTSALSVTNCGADKVDWTASTVPSVTLATTNGTLDAGSSTNVDFTIDADAYEPGAFTFKIKVSEPGHNEYVAVHGFRPTLGKDLVAGNGQLSGGQDAGGCANQCIVKAWLTPNLSSPNLKLDVKTHTPATVRVWFAKQAPNGLTLPEATSPKDSTEWTTELAPLDPDTKYYLLIRATDANGKKSSRSASFTTITPHDDPDGFANPGGPAGCALQCITTAVLSPGGTYSAKHLEVTSNTPARFQALASTKAPTYKNGTPSFAKADSWSLSGLEYITSWSTTLDALSPDTTYHIIVRATDKDSGDAYRVGSFHTPDEPGHDIFMTFHSFRVTHDGDSSWHNRGELSFAWGVGDKTLGTRAEEKMSDPATVAVPRNKSIFVAKGVKKFLPTVYVSASERDADGLVEFCSMGTGVALDWGRNGGCDVKWNVASSGIVSVDGIDALTRCSAFGLGDLWADKPCMLLETPSHGDDYARFTALISVEHAA